MKAFKFRIYPTKRQIEILQWTLDRTRNLYNAALQERRDAYRMAHRRISYYEQKCDLPEIKADIRTEYQDIHSQVLQDVLLRVEKAFKAFFRRIKAGETPGYPRFQGRDRYDSFTYPQGGYSLTHDNRVCLSKIGSIKVKIHRAIEGKVKTCTIKREGTCWYVVFACEVEDPMPVSDESVGIDLGLTHFATLSTGETIENPRYFRKGEKKLAKLQQVLSRKKRGSHRRKKAVQRVAKAHRKVRNQRADFLHKESRKLVNACGLIVFEELQPANMSRRARPKHAENGMYLPNGGSAKSGLNKSIQDAGWKQFVQFCTYKAECADRKVVQINPRYTSQVCSGCGTVKKKELSERWHSCECGAEL